MGENIKEECIFQEFYIQGMVEIFILDDTRGGKKTEEECRYQNLHIKERVEVFDIKVQGS